MKPIIETDQEFICDIQAPCFQMLSPEEAELVKASKTQVLFRKGDNLTKQGAFASYALFVINGLAKQYIEGDSSKNFNLLIDKMNASSESNLITSSRIKQLGEKVFLIQNIEK